METPIEIPAEKIQAAVLPAFMPGESGQHVPSLLQKMTAPPKRFTEASLLQSMETAGKLVDDETVREAMKENGIGRPSSRAGIIETLLKRGYIRREKKSLISNAAGRDLIKVIKARMLLSPELTGQWEKKLRDIEKGTFTLEYFMEELQAQLLSIIKDVQADGNSVRISSQPAPSSVGSHYLPGSSKGRKTSKKGPVPTYDSTPVKEGDECPVCKKGTVRKSQFGFFCSEYKTSGCRLTYKGGKGKIA